MIVTKPSEILNWSSTQISERKSQIKLIQNSIGFENVYELDFPAAKLIDHIPLLVKAIDETIKDFSQDEIFTTYWRCAYRSSNCS